MDKSKKKQPIEEPQDERPADDVCESCGKVDDDLEYYDNYIFGASGWMCGDCRSQAEMEL